MIYGTDSIQLSRHLRLRELLLVQMPCYATPLEGVITNIVGEEGDQYVKLEGRGVGAWWSKASDLQVIAILQTPNLNSEGLSPYVPNSLEDYLKRCQSRKGNQP